MTITVNDALGLFQALSRMDGHDEGAGEAKKRVAYRFSGPIMLDLAINLRLASEAQKAFEFERDTLIRHVSGGKAKLDQENDEQMIAFSDAMKLLMDGASPAKFRKIKVADLDLDRNPIPVSVLSLMEPILDQRA